MPPSGSYWSVVNGLGKGHGAYGLVDEDAKSSGQGGVALRWQPADTQLNLGLYALNYHDKTPNFSYNIHGNGGVGWTYAEDRKMYGVSANFPVGDWAVGTELSFRPKDAVALNAVATTCGSNNGNCWVDEKRYQWHLTGLYSLTPSNAGMVLNLLGAQTATLMAESVVIKYPSLHASYGGDLVSAGGWGWGTEFSTSGTPEAVGNKTSWGYNLDFSWVYDGTVLPGWQVVPEIYYFKAMKGRTPNAVANFMEGAQSANFTVTFLQNPTTWQFAVNYAAFWGGSRVFDQPLRDRNFVGAYLTRNF